jgi:hypothetical protein
MDDPAAILRPELGPEERLLWAGGARPGLVLRAADGPAAAFGAAWCATAGFGLVAAAASVVDGDKVPTLAATFLVGLALAAGRPAADVWRRVRTCYGVTTRRVLIAVGGRRPSIRSLPLDGLTDLTLAERPRGGGAILLGPAGPPWAAADRGWAGGAGPPRLELAADARQVYELILQARQAALQRDGSRAASSNPLEPPRQQASGGE